MKTKTISKLKKELLIIETPKDSLMGVFPKLILVNDRRTGEFHQVKGSYTLLGSPDDLKEEDVKDLVEQSIHSGLFAHYVKGIPVNTYCYKTALDSFHSALESEIYWEKHDIPIPYSTRKGFDEWDENGKLYDDVLRYQEAENRTLDKKQTLIFVKN